MTVYSPGRFYRVFVFVWAGGFGLGIGLAIFHLFTGNEALSVRAFLLLWIVGVTFGIYCYLFRVAYDLRFDTERLYWKSPLRSGSFLLPEVRRIRVRQGSDAIIEISDGRRVHVLAQKGFGKFCSRLAAQQPSLDLRIGLIHRFWERVPGSTMFRG